MSYPLYSAHRAIAVDGRVGKAAFHSSPRWRKERNHGRLHRINSQRTQVNGILTPSPTPSSTLSKDDEQQKEQRIPASGTIEFTAGHSKINHEVGHTPTKGAGSASRVDDFLRHPIRFVPATSLTVESERTSNRNVQTVKVVPFAQRRRRQILAASKISRRWATAIRSKPRGLSNPNALCYRRSTLQALLQVPAFVNWLSPNLLKATSLDHVHGGRYPKTAQACLACSLRNLIATFWSKSPSSEARFMLKRFDEAISAAGSDATPRWRHTKSYIQADAHEFLCWIIEILEGQFKGAVDIVNGLFKVRIDAEWRCSNCAAIHTSPSQDELGLQLPIVTPQSGTLEEYIAEYFSEELPGVRCEACNTTANRKRSRTISAAPEILIVQLQRFQRVQSKYGGRIESKKISKPVKITKAIDLSGFASNEPDRTPRTLRYELSSAVHHTGRLDSGHYINIAQTPNGIYEFDDDSIRSCSAADMLDPRGGFTPYILTYIAAD